MVKSSTALRIAAVSGPTVSSTGLVVTCFRFRVTPWIAPERVLLALLTAKPLSVALALSALSVSVIVPVAASSGL